MGDLWGKKNAGSIQNGETLFPWGFLKRREKRFKGVRSQEDRNRREGKEKKGVLNKIEVSSLSGPGHRGPGKESIGWGQRNHFQSPFKAAPPPEEES